MGASDVQVLQTFNESVSQRDVQTKHAPLWGKLENIPKITNPCSTSRGTTWASAWDSRKRSAQIVCENIACYFPKPVTGFWKKSDVEGALGISCRWQRAFLWSLRTASCILSTRRMETTFHISTSRSKARTSKTDDRAKGEYLSVSISIHIYNFFGIYIYIYIYLCCEVTNWATFWPF